MNWIKCSVQEIKFSKDYNPRINYPINIAMCTHFEKIAYREIHFIFSDNSKVSWLLESEEQRDHTYSYLLSHIEPTLI